MGGNTEKEISMQPDTWQKLPLIAARHSEGIEKFLGGFMDMGGGADAGAEILMVGAGSSEYIGKSLRPHLNRFGKHAASSCGTTDLVVSPESCLSPKRKTLLVSFARSGDSPESVGAIRAAEAVCPRSQLRQLAFTCNRQGALSAFCAKENTRYVVDLPDETNDKGFAMTNSFTSMYLMALLCLLPGKRTENTAAVADIAEAARRFLAAGAGSITNWADGISYSRIVYLGAEALKGTAQESGLKMLELTRGGVAAIFDTPVGFRHGPKSFVDDGTLVVLYLSDDAFARKYELDLLREMSRERRGDKLLAISGQPCGEAQALADAYYCFGNSASHENGLLAPEFVLVAQMLALRKSLSMRIDPDNPNPAGIVNRVVRGVNIYPYQNASQGESTWDGVEYEEKRSGEQKSEMKQSEVMRSRTQLCQT